MILKIVLNSIARSILVMWFWISSSHGDEEPKSNVTYPTYGTLTHIVFVSSKVGRCSGTLISVNFVLTVAHCLVQKTSFWEPTRLAGDKEVTVTAGITALTSEEVTYKQVRYSSQIIIHPRYTYGRLAEHDAALIKVDKAFEFSDTVFKADLWMEPWPTHAMDCQSSGFGSMVDPKHARLRMWDVVALHGEQSCPCTKRFQWKRLVCSEPKENVPQLCQGDAGSALLCSNKAVAIAHMTRERRTCRFLGYPECKILRPSLNIYTYVCPLGDWIKQYVPNMPDTPDSCKGYICLTNSFLLATSIILNFYLTVDNSFNFTLNAI
ncbi:mast cell protease 1-like [Homalodisca vitripennis]|nr:mast cell protease 1-like [Homalodisca vitripennis]